jgi:hypothetical protein
MGVIHRVAYKRMPSEAESSIICYGGTGYTFYGTGGMGEESTKSEWTGDCLSSGIDVVVKVEVATCVVTFILKGESIKWVDYPTTSQPINGPESIK